MAVQEWLDRARETVPRAGVFLNEVWAELKKVHWPSRKETYAATLVVLIVTIFVAAFLGVVDFAISRLIHAVLS